MIHFTDCEGADSVLPFKKSTSSLLLSNVVNNISGVEKIVGDNNSSVSLSNNSITITSPTNQGPDVIGCTSSPINLVPYTNAYIIISQYTSTTYGRILVGFSSSKTTNFSAYAEYSNETATTRTYGARIDISSLSGDFYLVLYIPKHGYSSSATIGLILLE